MMKRLNGIRAKSLCWAILSCGAIFLSACTPKAITPHEAADICEDRARKAQGVHGEVEVGVNSKTGVSSGIKIGVTSDYLKGRDPLVVYERCVFDKTGQAPIRPVLLR